MQDMAECKLQERLNKKKAQEENEKKNFQLERILIFE